MQRTIDIDGTRMAYDVTGSGDTSVILMHGWGCNSSTVASLAAVAAECATVYNLDMPGFGASQEPPRPWRVEDYVRVVERLVEAEKIERPVLMGHSFGGRVAIMYAARHGAEVGGLVLIDAAGIKPRRSLRYYYKVYTFKAARIALQTLLGREKAQPLLDRLRGKKGSPDYAAASPMMRATMSLVVNEDLTPLLPLIEAPTLLIWGENDTATPIADARKMERLIPDAGLVSFAGCGHYSFLDRPAQTAAVIRSFLISPRS